MCDRQDTHVLLPLFRSNMLCRLQGPCSDRPMNRQRYVFSCFVLLLISDASRECCFVQVRFKDEINTALTVQTEMFFCFSFGPGEDLDI